MPLYRSQVRSFRVRLSFVQTCQTLRFSQQWPLLQRLQFRRTDVNHAPLDSRIPESSGHFCLNASFYKRIYCCNKRINQSCGEFYSSSYFLRRKILDSLDCVRLQLNHNRAVYTRGKKKPRIVCKPVTERPQLAQKARSRLTSCLLLMLMLLFQMWGSTKQPRYGMEFFLLTIKHK